MGPGVSDLDRRGVSETSRVQGASDDASMGFLGESEYSIELHGNLESRGPADVCCMPFTVAGENLWSRASCPPPIVVLRQNVGGILFGER
jgi:hypothetical protein